MIVESTYRFHYFVDEDLLHSGAFELVNRLFKEENIEIEPGLSSNLKASYRVIFIHPDNFDKVKNYRNKIIMTSSDFEHQHDHIVNIDFNSVDDINALIISFKELELRGLLRERVAKTDKYLEQIKKNNLENIDINFYQTFIDLEKCLIRENTKKNWNEAFLEISNQINIFKNIQILSKEELINAFFYGEVALGKEALIFKVYDEMTFLYVDADLENKEALLLIEMLLNTVLRSFNSFDEKLIKQDGEIDIWKKVFSKIPHPMCIISNFGDLLVYNESFAKIGIFPKECLGFHDFENVEINKDFFQIRRIDFKVGTSGVTHFIFYYLDQNKEDSIEKINSNKASIDEFGIISSSIAHELNNPLAGVLAAISLLELEDDWSLDALHDIKEMKTSAKRCKELVEIFLGFSRFSPSASLKLSIKSSLDQAINLLRFRMIESNVRLEIDHTPSFESFNQKVNASVMSMIFYLIFSELMTAFAHHALISQNSQGALKGEVLELSNQLVIRIEDSFDFQQKVEQSKLVEHLLAFEKLEMKISRREIKIITKNEKL